MKNAYLQARGESDDQFRFRILGDLLEIKPDGCPHQETDKWGVPTCKYRRGTEQILLLKGDPLKRVDVRYCLQMQGAGFTEEIVRRLGSHLKEAFTREEVMTMGTEGEKILYRELFGEDKR